MEPWPGRPSPLGADWDGQGTNFALFSGVAEAVELCLWAPGAPVGDETRVRLTERSGSRWHGYVPGVGPGWTYGYRISGPYDPGRGARANPAKLLVDPYARAIAGDVDWDGPVFAGSKHTESEADRRNSAAYVPRSVVVDPRYDWGDASQPRVAWGDTVILEVHVKGFTARHPAVPASLRGTYAGLAHPEVIAYLSDLGVTAIELLPVHHFISEKALVRRGLTNFWGYNSLGYFAPHGAYSSSGEQGQQVAEFKDMVQALHSAGIEVILDVVYNHTAEGNRLGPSLSLRGIDNSAYYRLVESDRREYRDFSGCGNTPDTRRAPMLGLIMDSLRYWVQEMHVDGFRFDLASALARDGEAFDPDAAFFSVVAQDPVVSAVKLIAEPWDAAPGGYQVGRFPPPWAEWNGRYRDSVRDFWRGAATPGDIASRLTGSSDLYGHDGRSPLASVNHVASHDGFTLRDLVSYEHKHNRDNGEDNRDGENDNRSWNCGVEGDTDDAAVADLRARQQRNLLATLMLSHGVPMFTAGDERNRTQRGNNNAYCHDGPLGWIDWDVAPDDKALIDYIRTLLALRRAHPVLCRRNFLQGRPSDADALADVGWFAPDGSELDGDRWRAQGGGLAMFLNGDAITETGPRGERLADDSFLVILNPSTAARFRIPDARWGQRYEVTLDTACQMEGQAVAAGETLAVKGHSLLVLQRTAPGANPSARPAAP